MNLESEFKRDLVKDCQALGAYARRCEERYALGVLDLEIKFPNLPHLLAEGKIVPHQSFGPTKRQYLEGQRYIAAGGMCALIGWSKIDNKMYISEWTEQVNKFDCFHSYNGNHAEQLLEWLKTRQSTLIHQDIEKSTSRANSLGNTE